MRARVVRVVVLRVALLALLAVPAFGDQAEDALNNAVNALVLGDDPLDPYDDPPSSVNAFSRGSDRDDEDEDVKESGIGQDEALEFNAEGDPFVVVDRPVSGTAIDAPLDDENEFEHDFAMDAVDDHDSTDLDNPEYAAALDYDDFNVTPKRHEKKEEEEEEEEEEQSDSDSDSDSERDEVRVAASRPTPKERGTREPKERKTELKEQEEQEEPKEHSTTHGKPPVTISDSKCGPGSRVTVPVYYITAKSATKNPKQVETEFARANSVHRVESFEADDPSRADVIWTFASLGKIPVSSTVVDPNANAPMRERIGRLKSIGNSVSHLRAVAAAFDAGEDFALVLEDHQGNEFEQEWGMDLATFITTLPADWRIVNLGAYFSESEDVYALSYQKDAAGDLTVVIPTLVDEPRHEIREWVTQWDAAGRPSALPRPYRVSPDARLAGIKGGVPQHKGSSAWLLNKQGMRAVLKKYRRPDGSMHLDGASCTEYDTCVVSEVRVARFPNPASLFAHTILTLSFTYRKAFRDGGGIYEATPALFVQRPGPEQLKKFDTTVDVNDVLTMFRGFTKDWLSFVAGESNNGFLEHAVGETAAAKSGAAETETSSSSAMGKDLKTFPKKERRARHASRRKAALGAAVSVTPSDSTSVVADSVKQHELRVIAASLIAAGAADASADAKNAPTEFTYGYVPEVSALSDETQRLNAAAAAAKAQAAAEVRAVLDEQKTRAAAAATGIDWKAYALRNADYGEEPFYGTGVGPFVRPKRTHKYIDETGPLFETMAQAERAFTEALAVKEMESRQREEKGREGNAEAETNRARGGDGHWHSKRGRGGVALDVALRANNLDVASTGMKPVRQHIHFKDEPVVTEGFDVAPADPNAAAPRQKEDDENAVASVGVKPARRQEPVQTKPSAKISRQAKKVVASAGHVHHHARGAPSVVDKDGFECAARQAASLGSAHEKYSFAVFDELAAADRETAALGAAQQNAVPVRAALLAAGGVAAFVVVTRRAKRSIASDAERRPLVASEC